MAAEVMTQSNPLHAGGPPGMSRHRPSLLTPGERVVVVMEPPRGGARGSWVPPPPSLPPVGATLAVVPSKHRKAGSGVKTKGYIPAYKQERYKLSVPPPPEEESAYAAFQEKTVRHGFIRKVMGILAVQLLITIGGVVGMLSSQGIIDYVQATPALFYSAWVVTIIVLVVLACCDDVRRQFPLNYAMLVLFTVCQTFLLGVVSTFFDTTALVFLLAAVMLVSASLMIYAMQTKFDFTMCGGIMLVVGVVLLLFAASAIMSPSLSGQFAFAAVGSIMFSCFIVYDTQMVVGGKHRKYKLSPDEYVFAALNLYLDIITLFMLALFVLIGRAEK